MPLISFDFCGGTVIHLLVKKVAAGRGRNSSLRHAFAPIAVD
jgi:hypothetical protein